MNRCFLGGKIISKIDFRFFYNSKKNISVVKFWLQTGCCEAGRQYEKVVNQVWAYDLLADEVYSEYDRGDWLNLVGEIEKEHVRIIQIIKETE